VCENFVTLPLDAIRTLTLILDNPNKHPKSATLPSNTTASTYELSGFRKSASQRLLHSLLVFNQQFSTTQAVSKMNNTGNLDDMMFAPNTALEF
jgi:hypothetical protein